MAKSKATGGKQKKKVLAKTIRPSKKKGKKKGGPVIGIDEAGRGPVMGPLVVAAVRVEDKDLLKGLGLKDSKMLTRDRRDDIYDNLRSVVTVAVNMIEAESLDEMRKVSTLNEIEMMAFGGVLRKLYQKGDRVIVDAADVREEFFGKFIVDLLGGGIDMTSKHKADEKYPIVSGASIVAKVTRDRAMDRIEEELRKTLDEPLGSGYPADVRTTEFIEKWIKQEGDLPPYTRRSWKTARRMLIESMTATLDDFEDEDSEE